MTRKAPVLITAAALLLLVSLSACTSAQPSEYEVEESPPTSEPAPEGPQTSDRGHIIKEVGELATIGAPNGVEFMATNIRLDPECNGAYVLPPENGHFVAIDLDITVSPDADGDFLIYPDPNNWGFVDSDGLTINDVTTASAYGCLEPGETIRDAVGVGQHAIGTVILDIPTTTGIIMATPAYAGEGSFEGWEWELK